MKHLLLASSFVIGTAFAADNSATLPYCSQQAEILKKVLPGTNPPPLPETLRPLTRNTDQATLRKTEQYLKLSPEKWASLIPSEAPAPLVIEFDRFPYASNYKLFNKGCPFCGLLPFTTGGYFQYDIVNSPDVIRCAGSGKLLSEYPVAGTDVFTDYRGKSYKRDYILSEHLTHAITGKATKVYPQNLLARERINTICGDWARGVIPEMAAAYMVTKDERYAERIIAMLERLAQVFPAYPWQGHSSAKPEPRERLLEAAEKHETGFHGWLGPARLAAGNSNFRTPTEALYFENLVRAYMIVERSPSWGANAAKRKEFVKENLFREGALLFHAYGAKQVMGNGIGMYAPALYSLSVLLRDQYMYTGFFRILEDFLYNENFSDGISTEGSTNYSGMVNGMFGLCRQAGLMENSVYMSRNPFWKTAGRTLPRMITIGGGASSHGDGPNDAYRIRSEGPRNEMKSGEEFGGFGISLLRAGAADKRMELFFHHDRVIGHAHDDMLGIQLFYRGIPLLEHFGDTRAGNFIDATDGNPNGSKLRSLGYPAEMMQGTDPRRNGFGLPDVNTTLTKHVVTVDSYDEGGSASAYRGGQGDVRHAWGNLLARTGEGGVFQFVEAEGNDKNSHTSQGLRLYRRALCAITRPDGQPYLVDFFSVSGGHRHMLLFHSRGKEVESSLPHGKKYAHLDDVPDNDMTTLFTMPVRSFLTEKKVLNNIDIGGVVGGSWKHTWLFDYNQWASKTQPPAVKVKPHYLAIQGFFNGRGQAIRADGHYPGKISETINGKTYRGMVQFLNAVHYGNRA